MSHNNGKSFINFVRSTQNYSTEFVPNDSRPIPIDEDAEKFGKKISEEYKELITNSSDKPSSSSSLRSHNTKTCDRIESKRICKSNFKLEDIFKFCQNGQLDRCKQWLSQFGSDKVVVRDRFGWTPLMVAAGSGNLAMLRLLLDSDQMDCSLRCNQGLTARDIALKCSYYPLVEAIDKHLMKNNKPKILEKSEKSPKRQEKNLSNLSFECSFCGLIKGIDRNSHYSSISHQLKLESNDQNPRQTKLVGNYSHLDRANYRGYRLLVKEGWDERSGLGPKENGRRYPLISKAKPDRSCIGFKRQRSMISTDDKQRASKSKNVHRESRSKSRQLEIEFRRQFY